MAQKKESQEHKVTGAFFIPGGLFLGIGFGLLINNPGAGTMIGLGAGFVCWAIFGGRKK